MRRRLAIVRGCRDIGRTAMNQQRTQEDAQRSQPHHPQMMPNRLQPSHATNCRAQRRLPAALSRAAGSPWTLRTPCCNALIESSSSLLDRCCCPLNQPHLVLLVRTDPFFVSQHSIPIPTNPVASTTSGVKLIAETATDSALAVTGSAVKS